MMDRRETVQQQPSFNQSQTMAPKASSTPQPPGPQQNATPAPPMQNNAPPTNMPPPPGIPPPPGMPPPQNVPKVGGPPPPPPIANFHLHLANSKGGAIPPPPGMPPPQMIKPPGAPTSLPPPPTMPPPPMPPAPKINVVVPPKNEFESLLDDSPVNMDRNNMPRITKNLDETMQLDEFDEISHTSYMTNAKGPLMQESSFYKEKSNNL